MARGRPDVSSEAKAAFLGALNRLVPDGELGLAVSGGPDSLALLLLAAAARPGRVRAATVDHGLRAESGEEAAQVASYCAELGAPHSVLTVAVEAGASLQSKARESRYAALGQWAEQYGLAAVATAHHLDDQAETLLMRLARGSGVSGLAGIREERALQGEVRLVRPLLAFRKAELVALVEDAGWTAIDDPSNRDGRHERTRVRALLAATPWLDPQRLARSAAALRDVEEVLDQAVARARAHHWVAGPGHVTLRDVAMLRREIRRRLLLSALEAMQTVPSGPEVERLMESLTAGRTATLGAAKVSADGAGGWRVEIAPPRRSRDRQG